MKLKKHQGWILNISQVVSPLLILWIIFSSLSATEINFLYTSSIKGFGITTTPSSSATMMSSGLTLTSPQTIGMSIFPWSVFSVAAGLVPRQNTGNFKFKISS